jgi:protein SCO1/2
MNPGKTLLFFLAVATAGSRLAAQPPPAYTQRIGAQLPLATPVVDELGRTAPLADDFGGRPLLLIFGYYKCPQLCSVVERGVVDALRELRPTVGRDFTVAYLSIDPTDTPADARLQRATAARAYGRGDTVAGWHYLTGSALAVRAVADAAGFAYRYDPITRQYAHPSGFVVVTPQGVVSQYFLGIDFAPKAMADALERAGRGETGQPIFNLVLECFRGDFVAGTYGRLIWHVLQAAVALTLLAVFGGIGWMLRQERAARRPAEGRAA